MRGWGRLENTLHRAARPTPHAPGHEDQVDREPLGDVVYGECCVDKQPEGLSPAERNPYGHALRERMQRHDAKIKSALRAPAAPISSKPAWTSSFWTRAREITMKARPSTTPRRVLQSA